MSLGFVSMIMMMMMMVMILQIIRSKVKTLIEIEENLIQFDECENFEDERVKWAKLMGEASE